MLNATQGNQSSEELRIMLNWAERDCGPDSTEAKIWRDQLRVAEMREASAAQQQGGNHAR
jgi:hypothetical protein